MKKISFLPILLAILLFLFGCSTETANRSDDKEILPDAAKKPGGSESEADTEVFPETEIDSVTSDITDGEKPDSEEPDDDSEPSEIPEDTAESEQEFPEELVLPDVIYDESDTVFVMQVGGTDISKATFAYYLNEARESYPANTPELWAESAVFEIKCDVATELLAGQNGVVMSEEYRYENVDKVILETIRKYDSEDTPSYTEALTSLCMTDLVFRDLKENTVLQGLVYSECFAPQSSGNYANDSTVLAYVHENYARIKHILVSTVDLDETEKLAAKRKAEDILALTGSDGAIFEELILQYSDDKQMNIESGYYFSRHSTVPELEERAFELPQDSVSDVVESVYGYHIIKKYPHDDEYILSDPLLNSTVAEEICRKAFIDELFSIAEILTPVFYDNYQSVLNELIVS